MGDVRFCRRRADKLGMRTNKPVLLALVGIAASLAACSGRQRSGMSGSPAPAAGQPAVQPQAPAAPATPAAPQAPVAPQTDVPPLGELSQPSTGPVPPPTDPLSPAGPAVAPAGPAVTPPAGPVTPPAGPVTPPAPAPAPAPAANPTGTITINGASIVFQDLTITAPSGWTLHQEAKSGGVMFVGFAKGTDYLRIYVKQGAGLNMQQIFVNGSQSTGERTEQLGGRTWKRLDATMGQVQIAAFMIEHQGHTYYGYARGAGPRAVVTEFLNAIK